jgi:hypothetical protein
MRLPSGCAHQLPLTGAPTMASTRPGMGGRVRSRTMPWREMNPNYGCPAVARITLRSSAVSGTLMARDDDSPDVK